MEARRGTYNAWGLALRKRWEEAQREQNVAEKVDLMNDFEAVLGTEHFCAARTASHTRIHTKNILKSYVSHCPSSSRSHRVIL